MINNKSSRINDLEFLSKSSVYLLNDEAAYEEIFTFIADKLHYLTGSIIVVSEYIAAINSTVVRAVKIDKKAETIVSKILGSKIIGLTLLFDEETRKKFKPGKLDKIKDGLYELCFYRIHRKICLLIEKALQINEIYAMAFTVEKEFMGTVVIITRKKDQVRNFELLEAFINQTAMALKRKYTEKKLLETKLKLEEEKKRLLHLEKIKDEFINIASHELKTPLTSVKAYTQLLEKNIKKTNNNKAAIYINKLEKELSKMEKLINDMLDVSKIETGKLIFEKKKVDLNILIGETITKFQLTTKTHTFTKQGVINKSIIGDANRIQQVLDNLLNNAVKYSPDSNKIIVKLIQKSDEIIISIRDFGIGIPGGHEKKIFERYYRINEKAKQGLGLGLYIASEIIRHHRGRMWAEKARGKGTNFCFSLPLKS